MRPDADARQQHGPPTSISTSTASGPSSTIARIVPSISFRTLARGLVGCEHEIAREHLQPDRLPGAEPGTRCSDRAVPDADLREAGARVGRFDLPVDDRTRQLRPEHRAQLRHHRDPGHVALGGDPALLEEHDVAREPDDFLEFMLT
jgi:hypothetical protein